MKKILIPIAVVAIGAGAYIAQQQESEYNALSYIPADTPIFTGQLTPFPIKQYIASSPKLVTHSDKEMLDSLSSESEPSIRFFANIMKAYQNGLEDADLLVSTFGLADNIKGYFYTLGLLPVLKVEVKNPQAIWDLLDKNEKETGFLHKEGKLKELSYRSYTLTQPGEEVQMDLIVAQQDGLLTITLNTEQVSEDLLAMALGLEKPNKSLADSDMLTDIIKRHNFSDASVGFINHLEIIKGLTTTDGNQLAKQLTAIARENDSDSLQSIQTDVCREELTGIAKNWPKTVFGYTQVDISEKESTLAFSAVIESKNKVFLDALKALRGYIPNYTQDYDNSIVATSLGLDVSQLANSLTTIWSDLQKPSYQCAPLAQVQAQITQSGDSLAMVGMSANVAAGVKGVSAAIFDYSIGHIDDQPQLEKLDALVAIHADDPEAIFNSIKMFTPALQQTDLKDNGPAISLSELFPAPAELQLDPKLTIKGNHLIIYNGNKGLQEAEKLGLEKLSASGLYQVSFNAKKMFEPITTAAELAGEIIPEEAMFLTEYDARMNINLDINDQGIRVDSTVNNKSAQK